MSESTDDQPQAEIDSAAETEPTPDTSELPVPEDTEEAEEEAAEHPADPVLETFHTWLESLRENPNYLSDYTALGEALLDLTTSHPGGLAQLYSSRPTRLSSLIRQEDPAARARRTCRLIIEQTQSTVSKCGIYPTALAIGAASWTELPPPRPDNGGLFDFDAEERRRPRTYQVPVLLRPVEITTDNATGDIVFQPHQDLILNPYFIETLRRRGCEINPEEIVAKCFVRDSFTPTESLDILRNLGQQRLPGFELLEQVLVGAFLHPSQWLASDFEAVSSRAATHPLLRALVGDSSALNPALPQPNPADRDPDLERGLGDLGPRELDALEAVAAGNDLMIEAPPGSRSPQTLGAIIADAVASGRQVCYIPGTRRVGRVMAGYLESNQLSNYVVDLTRTPHWRSTLAEIIATSGPATAPSFDAEAVREMRRDLVEVREKLDSYTQRLHAVREPWGVSAYQALQALADLTSAKPGPRTKVRMNINASGQNAQSTRMRARELFKQGQELGILDPEHQDSPWRGAVLSTPESAEAAAQRVAELAENLPLLRVQVNRTVEETGLVPPVSLAAWYEQLEMIRGVRSALDIFQPEIFERSAADMVIATATSEWRREHSIQMKWRERRALVRQAKEMLRPGVVVDDLHAALSEVQTHRDVWRRHAAPGEWPRIPRELEEIEATTALVKEKTDALRPVLIGTGIDIENIALSDLENWMAQLSQSAESARNLPEEVRILKELHDLGVDELLADMRERAVPAELALAELDLSWWAAVFTEILSTDPALAGYDGEALRQLASRLRELDTAQVESLRGPVCQAIADRVNQALSEIPNLLAQLQKFTEEGQNIAGVYQLLSQIRPIWIIPPMLGAQLISPQENIDLLIIDQPDLLSVAELAALIARAQQVVVVGDTLRPWGGATAEFGKCLPYTTLPTDRGKLSEQVAVFLSKHGYQQVLSSVPSPRPASLVKLELVDGRGRPSSTSGISRPTQTEIEKVVDLVIEQALKYPDKSLAVVTLNPLAAAPIRQAVSRAVSGAEALQDFFSLGRPEPFVVVDSAGAKGLRRDSMILSIGFPKTPHGKVIHDFGPISGPSGKAHLIDALEVVRGEMTVVCSFSGDDLEEKMLTSPGPKMLADLLRQAGKPIGMERALATPDSFASEPDRLLVDLAERLWRHGLTVVPRFGLPEGMQVPLAIGHRDLPDELLVAVVSDDAAYAAEPSMRRRERYLPERLRQAHWDVLTVYSTEVFADPQSQAKLVVERVEAALERRREELGVKIEMPEAVADAEEITEAAATAPNLEVVEGEQGDLLPPPPRAPRPNIAPGLPLTAYGDDQLDEMLEWVLSDGIQRSEDEQVNELREALELKRKGAQVDAVLRNTVRRRAEL